ncbi:DUF1236 domain-containing protein [Methylocapsa acidiphila]|uniref:DUF1236 domain-containing protein n=1 Tax=Methylocapsa acidiphila TaxID=133552 RepID=UPI0003FF5D0D|nr:DUF1236 domain-containing protein [Methylocapsa acidiphila]
MTKKIASCGALFALLALPLAAFAEPTAKAQGAAGETAAASETAPKGAVLSAEQSVKMQQYVSKEKRPSTKVSEKLAVGAILPGNVELYSLPAEIGGKADVRYTVVNDHTVLVEAKTHKVTQILN